MFCFRVYQYCQDSDTTDLRCWVGDLASKLGKRCQRDREGLGKLFAINYKEHSIAYSVETKGINKEMIISDLLDPS